MHSSRRDLPPSRFVRSPGLIVGWLPLEEIIMAVATALLFPWSDTFSVNIGIIDTQHKNLVGMINDLHQAMVAGHGKDHVG
jgi:hypothetical protein